MWRGLRLGSWVRSTGLKRLTSRRFTSGAALSLAAAVLLLRGRAGPRRRYEDWKGELVPRADQSGDRNCKQSGYGRPEREFGDRSAFAPKIAAPTLAKPAVPGASGPAGERFSGSEWCPRRDSNPRPQDSYHFGFRRRPRGRSWSGLSLHPRPKSIGAARPVSTPSQQGLGLARDWQGDQCAPAFPDFERIRCAVSKHNAQLNNKESCTLSG